MKACSVDLRERAVAAVIVEGMSQVAAAALWPGSFQRGPFCARLAGGPELKAAPKQRPAPAVAFA